MQTRDSRNGAGGPPRHRAPIGAKLAALALPLRLPWAIQRHMRFAGVITVRIDPEHSFLIRTGSLIETDLFWRGFGRGWEGLSLRIWAGLAAHSRTIVDVGSNVGVYSLVARCMNEDARIVAFEPVERVHERLLSNLALNEFEVETERIALSDANGTATLYDRPVDQFKRASLERPERADNWITRTVTVQRFDDFAREKGLTGLDLLKVDIEGHEAVALKGMATALSDWRPTMLLEVLTDATGAAIWEQSSPLGYEAFHIQERRGLMSTPGLKGSVGKDRNFLVCQPEVVFQHGLANLLLG